MSNLSEVELMRVRKECWASHPSIIANAVILTPPILRVYALVKHCARRHRSSIAFWGHPLTGKSSCIVALEHHLPADFPGAAVVTYEAKSKGVAAEGTLIHDMLTEMDYEIKIRSTLPERRKQLRGVLYALAAPSSRLFLIIDEAQELEEAEFRWLKAIINSLVKLRISVTVILFGQQELLQLRDALVESGRSDLKERFAKILLQFENIRSVSELKEVLESYDGDSEYPEGSGISYTEFLWPQAYATGLRLTPQAATLWNTFTEVSGRSSGGVSMDWIAETIAEVADATKDKDFPSFVLTRDDWHSAIKQAGYRAGDDTLELARTTSARRTRTV